MYKRRLFLVPGFLLGALALSACEAEGPAEETAEKVGEQIDESVEAAGDAAERAADRVEADTDR